MRDEERPRRTGYHAARITFYVLLVGLLAVSPLGLLIASAQTSITIEDRGVEIEFPERMTFNAQVEGSADIERVVLEYGVERLTCGTVTAKAFPDFEPGRSVTVAWTWEMLQSWGSEPPGATIWYRWRAIDQAGNEAVSDEQRVVWLDEVHDWQSISRGMLTAHWYDGPRSFAEDLLNSAVDSLDQLAQTTGVAPQSPIDMYIYAGYDDLRDAVLFEPGWTGGLAFPEHDILVIGVSPDQVEWGKDAEAHELTHVLVGHLTFSCLGSVPAWLNEGIAMYGEGGPDPESRDRLEAAIANDELASLRALSGEFSEASDKANLSYSQSYSIVNFLVEKHGRDKLIRLFTNLRDGIAIEDALKDVYGFGLDGLEDEWRASIGAKPRRAEGVTPTPTPIPTPVPTYQPISAAPITSPIAVTRAPTPIPTPSATSVQIAEVSPTPAPTEAPAAPSSAATEPLSAPLIIAAAVAILVAIGAIVLSTRSRQSL